MVRINLTPGEKKREAPARRLPKLSVPRPDWLTTSPSMLVGLVGLVVLLVAVFLYFGERRGISEAHAAIEEAQADSARFHTQIARVRGMEEVQSLLVARVDVLEEVVEGRLGRGGVPAQEADEAVPLPTPPTRSDDVLQRIEELDQVGPGHHLLGGRRGDVRLRLVGRVRYLVHGIHEGVPFCPTRALAWSPHDR